MPAPKGNLYAAKDRRWRHAIETALANRSRAKQVEELEVLANKLIDMGLEGDLGAIQEIGNRLDGKPAQAIVGADGGPVMFEMIKRVIVDKIAEAKA